MYIPLCMKTDYSLLQSFIKIPELMTYLKKYQISAVAICDDRLFGTMEFYNACVENGIKPIIGLEVVLDHKSIYLYAENELGFQNLLKLNTKLEEGALSLEDLKEYRKNVLCILPLESSALFQELRDIYFHIFIGYRNLEEKKNALILSKDIVFVRKMQILSKNDARYFNILKRMELGITTSTEMDEIICDYLLEPSEVDEEDANTTVRVGQLCNVSFSKDKRYIPHYRDDIPDSFLYLSSLCKKGITKRLGGVVPKKYVERLKYELQVIQDMGFTDYFLIVFDYVKYAKQNNILAGPRGSAAGSLVSYALGISEIDPLAYDLLFERFLNPERISMPDIDMDFEFTKRDQVIDYVKETYGRDKVANIMTYGTLGARQALHDVGRVFDVDAQKIDQLSKRCNPQISLEENAKNPNVAALLKEDDALHRVYQVAYRFEGLKRHISTHAAGVVISSIPLDDIIPLCKSGNEFLTGYTMNYLEELGLLKMDFLALKNLTIIQNVLSLISTYLHEDIDINKIPLDDPKTLSLFYQVDTMGTFQFESAGMQAFLRKLKPTSFGDLIAAVALFRPGPMQNIDLFIERKNSKAPIDYLSLDLKPILESTYGIIVYQEQVMQILVQMGGYSYAEADNIRRAMSKKKKEVMQKERVRFVSRAINKGYTKDVAEKVYDYILKFANYGFNKAHSVCYARLGYIMGYLKSHYPVFFMANLLNISIGSEIKTKEYMDEAKKKNILLAKPDINLSDMEYKIESNTLRIPLSMIKNVGSSACYAIILEREKGPFTDFFDFMARCYGKSVNRKTIESLIDANVFSSFGYNHKTLFHNLDNALNYAELITNLDTSLVMKPEMEEVEEYDDAELLEREKNVFGFFITNHPASKYQGANIMKCENIKLHFDKTVDMIVIVEKVHKIKTKKDDDMAFLTGADETGVCDFVIFPKKIHLLNDIKKGDLIHVRGVVSRRANDYQINVINLTLNFHEKML